MPDRGAHSVGHGYGERAKRDWLVHNQQHAPAGLKVAGQLP